MAIADADYDLIITIVRQQSGIVLTRDKSYLLESRLVTVNEQNKFADFAQLAQAMRQGNKAVIRDVVDALTTNESLFFRDQKPFDRFRDVMLPSLVAARASTKTIRIWCAASSTGQEPYSLAIMLRELSAKWAGYRIEILGTDLCREVIKRSQEGIYSQFEVQRGMPIQLLLKYFKQITPDRWQLNEDVRKMVTYREFNLLESPAALGRFDIVFCRNVLIYFDQETKSNILSRIAAQMPDDGYLTLGGAETVIGISNAFELVPGEKGIYRKPQPKSALGAAPKFAVPPGSTPNLNKLTAATPPSPLPAATTPSA
jgi:chemotaxis protein methyltransferase CheR